MEEHTILASIDVESLYSCIPHNKGVGVVVSFLKERSKEFYGYNVFILGLLEFIPTHNVFMFDHSYYLQVQGVVMGNTCDALYANLYPRRVGADGVWL